MSTDEVKELIGFLRSVNAKKSPYANDLVRGWCHAAADALTTAIRQRDEALAQLSAEGLIHATAAKVSDEGTFTIPDGYKAERDAEGRATGRIIPSRQEQT